MLRPAAAPAPLWAVSLNLAMVFLFALCALVLLTRTLVSVAQVQASINETVEPATSGIVDNTALLSKLTRTNDRAARMLRAGRQVDTSLADVDGSMHQIVTQLGEVRTHAARIDGSVAGIAGSSPDVRRRVGGLRTSVATTDRTTRQTASSLAGSDRAVASVSGSLRGARRAWRCCWRWSPRSARKRAPCCARSPTSTGTWRLSTPTGWSGSATCCGSEACSRDSRPMGADDDGGPHHLVRRLRCRPRLRLRHGRRRDHHAAAHLGHRRATARRAPPAGSDPPRHRCRARGRRDQLRRPRAEHRPGRHHGAARASRP